jgi:hypothetical protein
MKRALSHLALFAALLTANVAFGLDSLPESSENQVCSDRFHVCML